MKIFVKCSFIFTFFFVLMFHPSLLRCQEKPQKLQIILNAQRTEKTDSLLKAILSSTQYINPNSSEIENIPFTLDTVGNETVLSEKYQKLYFSEKEKRNLLEKSCKIFYNSYQLINDMYNNLYDDYEKEKRNKGNGWTWFLIGTGSGILASTIVYLLTINHK